MIHPTPAPVLHTPCTNRLVCTCLPVPHEPLQHRQWPAAQYSTHLALTRTHPIEPTWLPFLAHRYAYSIASSQAPGGPIRYELHPELMLQPPWDNTLKTSVCGAAV